MAQHPWRGAALSASLPAVLYVIGATVGVLSNRIPAYIIPVSALEPFPVTFLVWGVVARSLRTRPEAGLWARATAAGKESLLLIPYLWWLGVAGLSFYHEMVGRRDIWDARFFHAFVGLAAAGGGLIWLLQAMVRRRNRTTTDGEGWADHHPWAEVIPGHSVALTFAWLVILAVDASSPLSIRLPIAGIVATSATLFWLYRGAISSRKARIAFHDALMSSEQQTPGWRLDN